MEEDREAKVLNLAREIWERDTRATHDDLLQGYRRELVDSILRELRPTDKELHRALATVSREREAMAVVEERDKMNEQFETMSQKLDLLGERLAILEKGLARIEDVENKKTGSIQAQSRVSRKALLLAASATLAVSAILVVPFLLGLLLIPAGGGQTRSVEVTLDIAALVAAVLGGGGIAAAGIAYAARQFVAAGAGGGPEEGG